jgi:hypothetical protein
VGWYILGALRREACTVSVCKKSVAPLASVTPQRPPMSGRVEHSWLEQKVVDHLILACVNSNCACGRSSIAVVSAASGSYCVIVLRFYCAVAVCVACCGAPFCVASSACGILCESISPACTLVAEEWHHWQGRQAGDAWLCAGVHPRPFAAFSACASSCALEFVIAEQRCYGTGGRLTL